MSPAEASEVLTEPDWVKLWDVLKVADDGFEVLLRRWREWHFTPVEINGMPKKKMGSSIDGTIALVQLGIVPQAIHENPLTNLLEQIDDHCWFVSEGRAWRILGIEDKMLMLNSFGDEKQIDLSRAKWEKYCEAHAAALEAQRK